MVFQFFKNRSDNRKVNKSLIPIVISSSTSKIDDGYYFDNYTISDPNATASSYHRWYPPYGIVSPYTTGSLNDPDATTAWLPDASDMTPWVQYELSEAKLIDKIKLVCWSNYSADFTCGITISCSNDGTNFDTLYTGTITGDLLSFTNVEFTLDNDAAYKYIRLSFDAPLSASYPYLFISKLNFHTYHYATIDNYDVNVIYKDDETKDTPTLEMAYSEVLKNANYAYCVDTGYYFYLSEPTLSAQRLFFNCEVDLLMTYKDDILKLGCIIDRQENEFNAYLVDDKAPILNRRVVNTLKFPVGFSNNDSYILATTGI